MRYSFIRQHRQRFRIAAMCRVLRVSPSGYYAWRDRPQSPHGQANRRLLAQIKAVHAYSRKTYGRRRIHAQLRRDGLACSRNRVARLMQQHGVAAHFRRRFRATTDSKHTFPVAPNRLNRNFQASAPNRV